MKFALTIGLIKGRTQAGFGQMGKSRGHRGVQSVDALNVNVERGLALWMGQINISGDLDQAKSHSIAAQKGIGLRLKGALKA